MDQTTFPLILTATKQLVQEKGCQQTTMQDIMERTGLSKGAIYHYVKSKDELFGNILMNSMEELDARFHQAVSQARGMEPAGKSMDSGRAAAPYHPGGFGC